MKINKKEFVRAKVRIHVTPGQMLKTLRELHGLSQVVLARRTGMTQSNIAALENGSRRIGRERALKFAGVLKVPPAVILFPDFDANAVA